MDARFVVKNLHQFKQELKSSDQNRRKAGETAAKVEAFRLMKQLKKELRSGSAGREQFEQLRVITRGSRTRKPLARLAKVIRYKVQRMGNGLQIMIGFLSILSSANWIRIATIQQEGFSATPEDRPPFASAGSLRRYWRRVGGRLPKGSRLSKYFFLRKTTKTLKTPARPIIDPFWDAHESEARRNIVSNFNRKMRGERI